jgi:hypothetical protein
VNEKADSTVLCHICGRPVGLTFDTAADENGQTVHESCYVKKVAAQRTSGRSPTVKYVRSSPRQAVSYSAGCK